LNKNILVIVIPYVKRFGGWSLIALGAIAFFLFLSVMIFMATMMSIFDIDGGFNSGRPTPFAESEINSGTLMQLFQLAQEQTNVPWAVLAAIAKIESDFGANMSVSYAGAVGFMQFMPTTWSGWRNPYAVDSARSPLWDEDPLRIASYGGYGTDGDGDGKADPYNPADAIASAAKYLKASGFEKDPKKAIFAYNHSWDYVNDVLQLAESYSTTMIPNQSGVWPLPEQYTQLSSPFGRRSSGIHEGIDIPCPEGTSVFAVLPGRVISAGWLGNAGYAVILQHDNKTQTMYFHFSKVLVQVGQNVQQGSVVGLSGNTGRSTGPHLHFGVNVNGRYCDPEEWLKVANENF